MDNIEIEAKTDRELLILVAKQQNEMVSCVKKINEVLFNNGWGIVAQVRVLWWVSATSLGIVIAVITRLIYGGLTS